MKNNQNKKTLFKGALYKFSIIITFTTPYLTFCKRFENHSVWSWSSMVTLGAPLMSFLEHLQLQLQHVLKAERVQCDSKYVKPWSTIKYEVSSSHPEIKESFLLSTWLTQTHKLIQASYFSSSSTELHGEIISFR